MKKIIVTLCVLCFVFFSVISTVKAQENEIEIVILKNDGLTQYSFNNYTLDCTLAKTNLLSIIVKQTIGYTYLAVSKLVQGVWVEENIRQLDKQGNVYNIQFTSTAMYRLRAIRTFEDNTTYQDYYVSVNDGEGQFIRGDIQDLISKGQWVELMMIAYEKKSFDEFKIFGEQAFRWFTNPAYIVTDFLAEIPMFLLLPHTWFIIAIVVSLVIWRFRKRIQTTRHERQLYKRYGERENLMKEKRKADEELRLRALNAMPTDYALELYGAGDWKSRSYCYHAGVPKLGVTYPSAYSLAFELGGALYSDDETRKNRAKQIIDALVDTHEPVLEKAYIYSDISACARAVSAESVEAEFRPVIRDDFICIAENAEQDAKEATEELSQKLKVKTKVEEGVSTALKSIEKGVKKGADKVGKDVK